MLLLFYPLTVGKHGRFFIIKIHQPKLEIHLNHQKYSLTQYLQLKYHVIWHKEIVDVKMKNKCYCCSTPSLLVNTGGSL